MEVSINDINDVRKELEVTASADELAPRFEKALREYLPNVEIKGFRKGKVPIDLVKKLHGESIEHQSLDAIVNDVYRQLVEERKLQPIGDPVLTKMDYKRGEALTFKITYEIKPTFDLKEYRGVAVDKPIHLVTDEEVEGEIVKLRGANSTLEEVTEVTNPEHVVTVDIQETDQAGSPLIGKKTTDARLHLSDESIFPQVKDALIHAVAGSTHRVTLDTEKEGKKTRTHLTLSVKKVERVILPELDEALVMKLTKNNVRTPDEFRKHLHADLERYWAERSDRIVTDALIGEIVRRHEFSVPESMVQGVLDSLLEEYRNRYPGKKLPSDFDEKEFREKNRGYAAFQAKWYLIRERIIETEHVEATDADYELLASTESAKVGIDRERLITFYRSSDTVQNRIVSDKLLSLIKERATITEKIADEPAGELPGSST